MNYVECIRKRNFLECKLIDNPGCKKLRESIFHCHQPDYEFLHKIFFEDFYYRNKTEEARLSKLKAENKVDLYEESHKNDPTLPQSITTQTPESSKTETDVESTQNGGATHKNAEEIGSTSQSPDITGAMK